MSWLPFVLQHSLSGLWALVWHWSIPVGIIILCAAAEVALEWFTTFPLIGQLSEPAVKKLQELLLGVMICAGVFLYGLSDGIKVEHARSVAQQSVILKQVGTVVDDVMKNDVPDTTPLKKGEVHKAPPDYWDNPEN